MVGNTSDWLTEAASGKISAKLEFANYEDRIVKRLGVKLVGWPCSTFDIDSLGTQDLQHVESLIQDGTIRWISVRASERSSVAAPQTRRKRNTGPAAAPASPPRRKKTEGISCRSNILAQQSPFSSCWSL
jgi:hypothetical protein